MESPCSKPGLWSQEGPLWLLWPNYRRSLAVKKASVDFLSEVTIGLGLLKYLMIQLNEETPKFLFVFFCEMMLLPWLYKLPLCWFSLIWKSRHILATSGFSSKEIEFGGPFIGWKHHERDHCSERRRKHICISTATCRRILGEKRQGLHSWA